MNETLSLEVDLSAYIVDQQYLGLAPAELQQRLAALLADNGTETAREIGRLFDPRIQGEKQPLDAKEFRMQIAGRLGLRMSELRWKQKLAGSEYSYQFHLDQ